LFPSESPEHKKIKDSISERLKEWTGASIKEYPSSGHELDVFAVTPDGISIYVEIIWSDTSRNFFRDMSMIQQSDANVKFVVVGPKILSRDDYVREFEKVAVSQRRIGIAMHGEMLDGQKIIDDLEYLNTAFKEAILSLVDSVRSKGKVCAPIEFKPPEIPSPDTVQERLLSNLFPVKQLPSIIYSSSTSVRTEPEVFDALLSEGVKTLPPFILKRNRLYSFANLKKSDSPFLPIISPHEIIEENVEEWMKDKDKKRDLMRLLNLSIRKYLLDRPNMRYDKVHRRFICLLKNGRDNYFTWRPKEKFTRRALAKRVYGKNRRLLYCMHQSTDLRFMSIDDKIYLKIEPTFTFTQDGYEPFRSEKLASYMSRWIPKQFNELYLNQMVFWAKYLSKLDYVITIYVGDQRVVIDTTPMMTQMNVGISVKKITQIRSA